MPLDSGGLGEMQDSAMGEEPAHAPESPVESYGPSIHSGPDVGQALRALRESRGLTLADLAETTRVRASYLSAIEEMRLDQLPSRPFVIGYIRAYAQALGANGDQAVERFKAEEPVLDEPLPEPVGVGSDRDPRLAAIIAGAVVIIVAIVAWNVVQRVMTETAPAPPTASDAASAKALANTTAGPVALGAPLPAPVESTTPPPYQTPGLDKAVNAEGQPLVANQPAAAPVDLNLPKVFTPRGQIYGVPPGQAAVTLQALKPAFLVVHGADGSIYFARQLNEGEAYRAPNIAGMTVDVSEPEAFQVFSGGASHGVLPQPLTPVEKLIFAAPAPPAPKPAATASTATPTTAAPSAPRTGAAAPRSPAATAKPATSGTKPAASPSKSGATTAKAPAAATTKPKAKAEAAKPKSETAKPKAEVAKPAPAQDDQPPF